MDRSSTSFSPWIGRMFVHPMFDYALIGGGLSLLVIPLFGAITGGSSIFEFEMLPWFLLCSNSAHFAASTVRLYTKEGTRQSLPFATSLLPAVFLVLVGVSLFFADVVGRYLLILYLTWSPYHYSAQAFGLSMMYCHRSGCQISPLQKRLLWWITLLPFLKAFIAAQRHFLPWVLPPDIVWNGLTVHRTADLLEDIIRVLAVTTPLLLFWRVRRTSETPMPIISLLVVLTNAIWFVVFDFLDAFVLSTIFHGIQYLAIVMIFHVRERLAREGNRRSGLFHALSFYGICVVLGFGLFNCWPIGNELLGFDPAASTMVVIAAINIHHFVVDAKIWKLAKDKGNRRIMVEDAANELASTTGQPASAD